MVSGLTLAYHMHSFVRQGRYYWVYIFQKLSSRVRSSVFQRSTSILVWSPLVGKWLCGNRSGCKGSKDTWFIRNVLKIQLVCEKSRKFCLLENEMALHILNHEYEHGTWFWAFISFLSSFSAPAMFVPLSSENISDGHGRQLM